MLVLDANILIRAALGSRVLGLLWKHGRDVQFLVPGVALHEAREHLPRILEARNISAAPAIGTLEIVARLVQTVEAEAYASLESVARERIGRRDEDDGLYWPLRSRQAARFGPKTPTFSAAAWTTDRVELYLTKAGKSQV